MSDIGMPQIRSSQNLEAAGSFLLKEPVNISLSPPAVIRKLANPAQTLQLVSATSLTASDLPVPGSSFHGNVKEVSWSPDHRILALTFTQTERDGSQDKKHFEKHVVWIDAVEGGIRQWSFDGFCKAL